jgi:glycine cleavage system aminomethyltransferase T
VVDSPDPMLWGGELVLCDGIAAGQVTSTAYGATVGASLGLALLRVDRPVRQEDLDASTYEVDLAGERHGIRISLRAPLA